MYIDDIEIINTISNDREWRKRLPSRLYNIVFENAVSMLSEYRMLDTRLQCLEFMSNFELFFFAEELSDSFIEWYMRVVGEVFVFFIPIKRLKSTRSGSAHSFAYNVSCDFKLLTKSGRYLEPEGYRAVAQKYPDAMFVFLDDFSGTGDTADSLIVDLNLEGKENVLFFSSVSMERARKRISRKVPFYCDHEVSEAFETGSVKEARYNRMEGLVWVRPEDCQGFKRSRALVAMRRTPNNTLPIFWADQRSGGGVWPAMFAR